MIADAVEDQIVRNCVMIRREQDADKKAERVRIFDEEQLPAIMGYLEAQLVANNGGNGFFVGDKVRLNTKRMTEFTTI